MASSLSILVFFLLAISFTHSDNLNSRYDVIIVGAGASGIAAASKLLQEKVNNFVILEAKDRIGGRIYTDSLDGETIDFGSDYVFGESPNIIYNIIGEEHIGHVLTSGDYESLDIHGKLYNNSVVDQLIELSRYKEDEVKDFTGTYPEFVTSRFQKKLKELNIKESEAEVYVEIALKILNAYDSSELPPIGPRGCLKMKEIPGRVMGIKNGFSTLLDILMGKYSEYAQSVGVKEEVFKEKIQLNKPVKRVNWDDSGVEVECKDGSKFLGARVLITLPLGVLKEVSNDMFQPPLPASRMEAINDFGVATYDKIFLKFENLSWHPKLEEGIVFGSSKADKPSNKDTWTCGVTEIRQYQNSNTTLVLWVIGTDAAKMEKKSIDEVKSEAHALLQKLLNHQNIKVPEIKSIKRSSWATDPYARGSFNIRTVTSDEKKMTPDVLGEPVLDSKNKPVILFAGEATIADYFSTAHGAVSSGAREAERIVKLK